MRADERTQRVRLEGRLEVLEAASVQLRQALEALGRCRGRARQAEVTPLIEALAHDESAVARALASVDRCIEREGWDVESAACRVAESVRSLREGVLSALSGELRRRALTGFEEALRWMPNAPRQTAASRARPQVDVRSACLPVALSPVEIQELEQSLSIDGGTADASGANSSGSNAERLAAVPLELSPRRALVKLVLELAPVRSSINAPVELARLVTLARRADEAPHDPDWRRVLDLVRLLADARRPRPARPVAPLYRALHDHSNKPIRGQPATLEQAVIALVP